MNMVSSVNDVALNFRMASGGTPVSTSNHYYGIWTTSYNSAAAQTQGAAVAQCLISNSGSSGCQGSFEIYSPQLASPTGYTVSTMWNGPATVKAVSGGGLQELSTSYDGILIYPASGNITGIIRVYGYRQA